MKINKLSLDFREKTSIFAAENKENRQGDLIKTTENKGKRLQNIGKQGENKTKTMAKPFDYN